MPLFFLSGHSLSLECTLHFVIKMRNLSRIQWLDLICVVETNLNGSKLKKYELHQPIIYVTCNIPAVWEETGRNNARAIHATSAVKGELWRGLSKWDPDSWAHEQVGTNAM